VIRALYVDLDGTLLGRGASLLHDAEGSFSLLGVRALEACSRVGAEVVIMSGRREAQVMEDARLIGQTAYIYEAGAGVVLDGEHTWLTGEIVPRDGVSIHDQIEASGAPGLLLERYAGRLEYHDPWHRGREVSHLFRGLLDAFEADELLAEHGHGDLRIVDNGVIHRRSEALADLPQVRAYHLVPQGASKARAVAWHMQARGYAAQEVIGIGDSREDLEVADQVGEFWLVANAVRKDPTITEAVASKPNARVAEGENNAGVYEAVITALAERRAP
jgi:hydroxymethylpyrimidine pyrophosphatase-like HAD family hydrolase